ncbi:HAD family hydrolase [Neobacillus terrae]|uniref:HAD family hydrolase n=1 Tax=Neobacillus terrae TaxID=3034837 RepID=UPI00140A4CFA|nr:HAD family hydrolase [Neobacillus terrae]NHM30172.1 HAD family phosphatase [Neobacillus terrae]
MIKCIATDMDGTLLNSSQKISDENRDAILKAQSMGVEVVVATGRSYQEAILPIKEAGLNCPVIGVNGAEVRSVEGEILSVNTIENRQAEKAAAVLKENNVYFEVYTNKGTYTNDAEKSVSIIVDIIVSTNPDANYEKAIEAAKQRVENGMLERINDYGKLFADKEVKIYKFLAFSFDNDRLEAARTSLAKLDGIVTSSSGHENLEITSREAQKGIALEAFVNERGILLEETMAIGDNFNDVSMFKKAGHSVAMGNAPEMIKEQCDEVTATNEESGVAKAIMAVLK